MIVAGAGSTTTTVKATAIKTAVLTTNLQGCKSTGAADQVICGGQGSMTAAEASAACDGDSNEIYLKFY